MKHLIKLQQDSKILEITLTYVWFITHLQEVMKTSAAFSNVISHVSLCKSLLLKGWKRLKLCVSLADFSYAHELLLPFYDIKACQVAIICRRTS